VASNRIHHPGTSIPYTRPGARQTRAMAAVVPRALALLAGCAAAQQDATFLLQSVATSERLESLVVTDQAVTESFDLSTVLLDPMPEWCKNDTQLTWKQRKERMQQHTTLQWCKKQVKELTEKNESVPEWMEKLVTADENRGKMKWAVQEASRMRAEQKEVPKWMAELVEEDAKWANRWAACKVAELKAGGEEVPVWMVENARKGITDYAAEKAQELQDEIDELDEEKEKELALVHAQGDVVVASEKMLARTRANHARSTAQQFNVVQKALEELDLAEQEFGRTGGSVHKLKHAIVRAREETDLLNQLLSRKMDALKIEMEAAA